MVDAYDPSRERILRYRWWAPPLWRGWHPSHSSSTRYVVGMSSGFAWCSALVCGIKVVDSSEWYRIVGRLCQCCYAQTKNNLILKQCCLVFVYGLVCRRVSFKWLINFPAKNLYELKTSLRATIFDDLHNPMPTSMGSISIPRTNPPKLSIPRCKQTL